MDAYIGVMSGTSLDGIDAAIARFPDDSVEVIDQIDYPLPDAIRQEAYDLITNDDDSLNRYFKLANQVAKAYAHCINELTARHPDLEIRACGCHGQTLRHFPVAPSPFTVQAINGAGVALETGLITVTDFRSADMWCQGQGAPLAPAFHAQCFRDSRVNRVIVNLGGIANVTFLPANQNEPVIGFDTGLASGLMDLWIQRHLGKTFDEGGKWAASGRPDPRLLEKLSADPYFALLPPKSTGKEYFNEAWLDKKLKSFENLSPVDIQATLLEFTVATVTEAIQKFCPNSTQVFVCGGGRNNVTLMTMLAERLAPAQLGTTAALGIEPQLVEATAFAWLAKQRMERRPGNLASVTGANQDVILGAVYLP